MTYGGTDMSYRPSRTKIALLVAAALSLSAFWTSVALATAAPTRAVFTTIEPGGHPALHVATPVNLVFVGYQPKAVDVRRILGQLPAQGDPIVRAPGFYGIRQDVGLRYDYRYNVQFAGRAFDDAFFGYLAASPFVGPPEPFQQFYNQQQHNVLDVGPRVRFIDAPATEAWLEHQSQQRLGIRAGEDTVFLVNWYGRKDFQFHSYFHTAQVDPDTGIDVSYWAQELTRAWGGSSGPTWFYDLSAGPVWADNSWVIDDADLNGDGVTDYRIPPIWEYGNATGYRPFTDLSGDLAKVIRYVAIDTLFTPSPVYDPAASVPGPDGIKQIALDIFEGDPATNGLNDVHPQIIQAEHQRLEPYYGIDVTVHDQPLTGPVLDAFDIANGQVNAPGCWNEFGVPYAELYCFFRDHRADYFPSSGEDAVIPVAGFTVARNPFNGGDTGDDWRTGAPAFIYEFDTPLLRQGFAKSYTAITIHEVGHFVGLSHPHDGYDSATAVDFGPVNSFDFAWAGDESATVMSYLPGNETFDVFNRDNLARWQLGRLLDLADTDAAAILARPHSAQADLLLAKGDAEFTAAVVALHTSDWITAAVDAVAGYRNVQRADIATGLTPASARIAAITHTAESSVARAGHGAAIKRTSDVIAAHPVRPHLPTRSPWRAPASTTNR
jgi:hypothetical protein